MYVELPLGRASPRAARRPRPGFAGCCAYRSTPSTTRPGLVVRVCSLVTRPMGVQQERLLGEDEVRRVDSQQHFVLLHEGAGGRPANLLHPALRAGNERVDRVLVGRDPARRPQRAHAGDASPRLDADRLLSGRRHGAAPACRPGRRAAAVGVDGLQAHAAGRTVARPVGRVLGMHRAGVVGACLAESVPATGPCCRLAMYPAEKIPAARRMPISTFAGVRMSVLVWLPGTKRGRDGSLPQETTTDVYSLRILSPRCAERGGRGIAPSPVTE